ncbi:IbrB-like domain-containing protein [Dyella sedimenti]|uniref:IbrB-like domain-containing protein n=1 Tax=Dyella sedimenti TaxID=2919947 RepID=UPI001FA9B3CF|nr:ParB/RepB/Spo0J family partition protein [Dyella sedimenti]
MPQPASLMERAEALFRELDPLPLPQRVEALNHLRRLLHEHSPFAGEPVDCVQWVPGEQVQGNDYNPNTVAPPEMKLLALSIEADGFTQPIVAHPEPAGRYVVVDGFHRQRVARKPGPIRQRLHGYLPVALVRGERGDMADRIAATIRHNRARGVHGVLPMTDIVVALLQAGWSEGEVARQLGMDDDEVLRFKQVSGLPELFRDHPYSKSWD